MASEPSVQVPVPLIDTLRDLIERDTAYDPANPNVRRSWEHGIDCESIAWGYDGIEGDSGDPCDCWVSVITALLSQPTPTAEPMRAAQGDGPDRLIEFAEHVLGVPLHPWQKRLCRRVFGGNVGRSTGSPDAAPPSIADMAPGTTFDYPTRWEVSGRGGMTGRVIAEMVEENTTRYLDDLDPSTIRDVTPPNETSKETTDV